jgi:hypothetical protein
MAEAKRSATLTNILGTSEERSGKGHSVAGPGEQAFSIRADFRDGRRKRALAWSHFTDYQWKDHGDHEELEIIFGDRILTIKGHNLMVLGRQIDEGKLKSFEEELTARITQAQGHPPDNEALVTSVEIYPEFDELLKEIRGESDDKQQFARRVQR